MTEGYSFLCITNPLKFIYINRRKTMNFFFRIACEFFVILICLKPANYLWIINIHPPSIKEKLDVLIRKHILIALKQSNEKIHRKKGAAELLGVYSNLLRSGMKNLNNKGKGNKNETISFTIPWCGYKRSKKECHLWHPF